MRIILMIVIKEFLQLQRDPRLFAIIFMAPVLQLVFLGYAATMDLDNINTVVMDNDRTVTSRNLIEKFEASGYFSVIHYASKYEEIESLIDKGKALTAIVIPKDFEKNLNRREQVKVQGIFDGSDGNKASIAAGYAAGIIAGFAKNIIADYAERSGRKTVYTGVITPEIRVWYNPDLKTRNFMVPAIMGLVLMVITTILMSMAIVKEREIGTLEQLIVTPIKPYQLILGKLIPFFILGFVVVLIVLAVMVFWFGIHVRGSYLFLLFVSLLFVLSTLGFGLFISTISKTQQQAMLVALFGLLMPMIYLSGFAFPIENMPQVIQYITYFIPLKYYTTMVRDIILKGSGPADLVFETFMLFTFGILILTLSSLRFRKRLE